jgi:four helix bundle protein
MGLRGLSCRLKEVRSWKTEARSRNTYFFKEIIMKFKFEKLVIWQKAMDFGEDINNFSGTFPKKEIFNLSSQILRTGDSIALNISEGSIGQSNPEFRRFMGYSIRSLAEVVTCLHKAKRRKYYTEQEFNTYYNNAFNLMNMMIAFKKSIK